MTSLIAWESLNLDGVSQGEATDSIARLFGLTSDPFKAVASDHRTASLIRAVAVWRPISNGIPVKAPPWR